MCKPSSNVIWVDLQADGKPLKMELDTGSAVFTRFVREKFNDKPLYTTELALKSYTGKTFF